MILMFTVPTNVSSPVQIAYLFITNFLFSAVIYTIICVPYQAIMVVRTNSQEERAKMGTWRAAAGYVSGMIIAVMTIPITNMLGGDQKAWVIFSAVLAVISALLLFVTYKTSKEYPAMDGQDMTAEAEPEEESVPFSEALKNLFHNKYWVMALVLAICSNIFYGLSIHQGHTTANGSTERQPCGNPRRSGADPDDPRLCGNADPDQDARRHKITARFLCHRYRGECTPSAQPV